MEWWTPIDRVRHSERSLRALIPRRTPVTRVLTIPLLLFVLAPAQSPPAALPQRLNVSASVPQSLSAS